MKIPLFSAKPLAPRRDSAIRNNMTDDKDPLNGDHLVTTGAGHRKCVPSYRLVTIFAFIFVFGLYSIRSLTPETYFMDIQVDSPAPGSLLRSSSLAIGKCLQLLANKAEFANYTILSDSLHEKYHAAKAECLQRAECAGIAMTLLPGSTGAPKVPTFSLLRAATALPANLRSPGKTFRNSNVQYVWHRTECTEDKMQPPDLPRTGFKVGDRDTVFVQATTYRDPDCHLPILTGLQRAKHPERIFFGVVFQNAPGDFNCSQSPVNCTDHPDHVMCKYRDNIIFQQTNATDGKGPTHARHLADALYGNQTFAIQIDGHMSFINNWDEIAINQWKSLNNEMAVITTYPCEVATCIDKHGNSMCSVPSMIGTSSAKDPKKTFRHHPAGILSWTPKKPLLNPFLGAGVVFSKGHRIVKVPNDCCTPWVFDGEEFLLGARLLSHGYDLYSPSKEFVYHPYERKRVKKFWDQMWQTKGRPTLQMSVNRMRHILGQEITGPYNEDHFDEYKLATQRNFTKIMKVYGINLTTGIVEDYSKLSFDGITNSRLAAFVTPHGVDYAPIPEDIITRDARRPARPRRRARRN